MTSHTCEEKSSSSIASLSLSLYLKVGIIELSTQLLESAATNSGLNHTPHNTIITTQPRPSTQTHNVSTINSQPFSPTLKTPQPHIPPPINFHVTIDNYTLPQ